MRPYLAILGLYVRSMLQYRAAALAGFGTQLFWGLIRVMIFHAFYASTRATQPMTESETISYIWLGQAMLLLIPFGPDRDIRAMIANGSVAYELLRPLDTYWLWYLRCLAARFAPVLLRCVPLFVVAGLFLGLSAPPSLASAAAWLASTAVAMLLSASVAVLISITLLWTISGEGISRIIPAFTWFFSGLLIPLPLLPQWAQAAVALLPFRGMADTPFRIYVGHIAPEAALAAIGHQLLWTVLLVGLGHAILGRHLKRLVVQGG